MGMETDGEAVARQGDGRRRGTGYRRRRSSASSSVYAAVDLGTNNCRMLVARPQGKGLRVVDSFSRIVRLGEGLAASGRLGEEAMQRTVEALKVCSGKMRANGASRIRNVATEACRRARNCRALMERVEAEAGLVLEPISSDEEAQLTLMGCAPLLDSRLPHALVFDIGGGSTEVTWVEQRRDAPPRALGMLSMPFGVVDLAERFGCDTLGADDFAEMVAIVDVGLAEFDARHGIAAEIAGGGVQMLGTSGTVTTLGALCLDLPRYDRSAVDGLDVEFDGIATISARLAAMDCAERAANPCIGRQRADLVGVGCAILEAICRRWPVGRLRVADRGIREGLLMGMMAADAARQDGLQATRRQ